MRHDPLTAILSYQGAKLTAKAVFALAIFAMIMHYAPQPAPCPIDRPRPVGITVQQDGTDVAITSVIDGSAAEIAGLKVGDCITYVSTADNSQVRDDGQQVNTIEDLRKFVEKKKIGTKISVQYLRAGSPEQAIITLGTPEQKRQPL